MLTLLLFFLPISVFPKDKFLDFIYVDANTGQSSGGHSALRFEDTVIHFQYYPDGIFRVIRESYDRFFYSYNTYSNRTSKIAKIKLSEQNYEKIRDGFDKVSIIQFKHLNNLESLRKDNSFLSEVSQPERKVKIKSFGYFQPGEKSPMVSKIKDTIEIGTNKDRLGKFRSEIKRDLENSISEGRFENFSDLPIIEKGKYPFYKGSLSSWFLPKLEKLAALEILNGEYNLSENAIFVSASSELTDIERKKMIVLQEDLFQNTVALLENNKINWGNTVLINLARLFVLEKSLNTGKLHFLISFPENVTAISGKTILENKISVQEDSEILFTAAKNLRESFENSPDLSEDMYTLWEDLENRDWELRTGLQRGISIRNTFEKLSPDLSGEFLYSFPSPEKEKISKLLTIAKEREKKYDSELQIFYDFKLIRRNCTTELFDVLDSILSEEEYKKTFGNKIDPRNSAAFIPFLAYDSILENWKPTEEEEELSYRKNALAKMYKTEGIWKTYIRESNTLSSSLYKSNAEDPDFLFFTDDVFLIRPLYGVINLGWGLGNLGLGIFTLPFDRGKRIKAGIQSAFFSLPELVFFNIRKGSFPNAKDPRGKKVSELKPDQ